MKIITLDRIFAGLVILLGIHVVTTSIGLGLYRGHVPGPGFFPMASGVLILVLAIALLARSFLRDKAITSDVIAPATIAVIGVLTVALVVFVFAAPLLGLSIATFILMVITGLLTQEPDRRGRAFYTRLILASAATAAICHVLFGQVIRIPLIYGPLGI
ncbi:tripartite tricarboxylate transporter TctB family protein [Pelagibacterium lacus]|uniref:DUF1468 domain-containing protein n=1 Tax=Pelagibacterium lacus TaxID=2282655 RepID=A0A369W124_9HYPH|nr:tripartite tricarboxylate transporter TctB family protein [Pelagibacterium lacus]RDE07739.1 hypothetical protein DVH29_15145 [Pelagibacterium lacus]